jgi:arginine decarboxylase
MNIYLTYGTGEAPTELSAFDAALFDTGIANYNLIRLSSVIPDNSKIIEGKIDWNQREFGHRLYLVMSQQTETKPGKEAWAGVGWLQDKDGKGLFVEHHGSSEKLVKENIIKSLTNMQKYRPEKFGPIQHKLMGIMCKRQPVCALVCAVFKSEKW